MNTSGRDRNIVENGQVNLENALVWGGTNHRFTFKDCRRALLFMDGFDEFIDEAKKAGVLDIGSFMKIVDDIAEENDIHIVVLSRTTAVKGYIEEPTTKNRRFQLLPLTKKQQDEWLKRHDEYADYRETFNVLRKEGNMHELLGIPLLFRLIVHSRFNKISSNIVELYDNLFLHLMDKRNIHDENLISVRYGLMDLAYKIYCTDTDLAVMKKEDLDKDWVFAFYLKILGIDQNKIRLYYKVGFYHRSFYQFFLAKYIYLNLLCLTNNNAKEFIGYFAERELDKEVRLYLSLMIKDADKDTLGPKMDIVIDALVKTQAYCNLTPKYAYGDAEKSNIGRSTNIYRNVMHIAFALAYTFQIPFTNGLDVLIRTFRSDYISIYSDINNRADLSRASLNMASLSGAFLSLANLSLAHMSLADLNRANLGLAHLNEAILSRANLDNADLHFADLKKADLSGAHLVEAELNKACLSSANLYLANLHKANLKGANLSNAKLRGADLSSADLSLADLSGANLSLTNLSEAHLKKTTLNIVDLSGANLSRVDMSEANLSGADLSSAHMCFADLSGADLSFANLSGADLSFANLTGSDLNGAYLDGVTLSSVYIDEGIYRVKSLKNAVIDIKYRHLIPSNTIGYQSIKWINKKSG